MIRYLLVLVVALVVATTATTINALLTLAHIINVQAASAERIDSNLDVVIARLTTVLVPEERT